jgi:hypothetical protein
MESEKHHYSLFYFFTIEKVRNAFQARYKISDVYREDVLTERQFDVEYAPRSGWPLEADEDSINAFIDTNRRIT